MFKQNKQAFTNHCHAERFLLSIPTAVNMQGRDSEQQHLRMTLCKGFTLIELLVVVLIIGILAAVALPQYQKAVEKTKVTQALVTLKAVYQAYTAYYLEKGTAPTSFSQLDVSLPWTPSNEADTLRSNEDWKLGLTSTTKFAGIALSRKSGPYVNSRFYIWHYYHNNPKMDKLSGSIMCAEDKNTYSGTKQGSYCVKLFHAKFIMQGSTNSYYQMPSI